MKELLERLNLRRDLAIGILLIAAGILFCWHPLWAPKLVLKALGAFLVVDGALTLFRYAEAKNNGGSSPFPVKYLAEIAGGVYLLAFTENVISLVLGVLGAVMLIGGVIQARRVWHGSRGLLGGLLSLLLIVVGISMLLNPMSAATKVFVRLGILLIICGVIRLITANRDTPAKEPTEVFDME